MDLPTVPKDSPYLPVYVMVPELPHSPIGTKKHLAARRCLPSGRSLQSRPMTVMEPQGSWVPIGG